MNTTDAIIASVELLAEELRARGATMATAESCTGGWIAKVLTDLAGSSEWFAGGIVSYSNDAKSRLLGVAPETIRQSGAVSEATVREMAEGVRERVGADHGLAVSGIAGPGGGTADKPVGTVWIAWADDQATRARVFHFEGDREAVRVQSVAAALAGVFTQ